MSPMKSEYEESRKLAFIGFGEAASAFVKGWSETHHLDISAFDIKSNSSDEAIRAAKHRDYSASKVQGFGLLEDALSKRPMVMSTVTADQALTAAESAAPYLANGAFYLDCNSCAPNTKRAASRIIEAAGGLYLDVAVMAPVHPKRHKVPLLVSGRHAAASRKVFACLGMDAEVVSDEVGFASSVKMIRSVMIKGLEALVLECVLSGRKAGVDQMVLESLDKTFPGFDWKHRAAYMMERVTTHGIRRAAEMREVALTVEQLGLSGDMSKAAVEWQQRIGALDIQAGEQDYTSAADQILVQLNRNK